MRDEEAFFINFSVMLILFCYEIIVSLSRDGYIFGFILSVGY